MRSRRRSNASSCVTVEARVVTSRERTRCGSRGAHDPGAPRAVCWAPRTVRAGVSRCRGRAPDSRDRRSAGTARKAWGGAPRWSRTRPYVPAGSAPSSSVVSTSSCSRREHGEPRLELLGVEPARDVRVIPPGVTEVRAGRRASVPARRPAGSALRRARPRTRATRVRARPRAGSGSRRGSTGSRSSGDEPDVGHEGGGPLGGERVEEVAR